MNEILQTIRWGAKIKFILREPGTFVEVVRKRKIIAVVPTRVADYCTGSPQFGKSYYWEWDGLQHQSKPLSELRR